MRPSIFTVASVVGAIFLTGRADGQDVGKPSAEARQRVKEAVERARQKEETIKPSPPPTPEQVAAVVSPRPRLPAGWDIPPEKPKPSPATAVKTEAPKDAEGMAVVTLEKVEVKEKREEFTEKARADIEARKARLHHEVETVEDSPLDQVLNHPKLAILGPFSTANRVGVANYKLQAMNFEQQILAAIDAAETEAERVELKKVYLEIRYGISQQYGLDER